MHEWEKYTMDVRQSEHVYNLTVRPPTPFFLLHHGPPALVHVKHHSAHLPV